MTTPASGPISYLDVRNELKGGSTPYSNVDGSPLSANWINNVMMGVGGSTARSLSSLRNKQVYHPGQSGTQSDAGGLWTGDANVDDGTGGSAGITAIGQQNVSTQALRLTNWGFALPSGATIRGILVTMDAYVNYNGDTSSPSTTLCVALTKNGTAVAGFGCQVSLSTSWTSTAAGGPYDKYWSDLWGASWVYTDVNATTFGVLLYLNKLSGNAGISHTVNVRNLRVRILRDV